MPFIVETPQTHPGIKLYVCQGEQKRQPILKGARADAIQYPRRFAAQMDIAKFSSLYGLIITEVPA